MGRTKSVEKRKLIMKAAESIFASRRFHESTLDDVARAAGVGKGTIYRYFKDKDDLFFQTAVSEFDDLCELLSRDVPVGLPFHARILEAVRRISDFINARRHVFGLGETEERRLSWCKGVKSERWTGRRMRLVAALSAILEQGRDEGAIRGDIPVDAMSSILLGMLRTRAMRRRQGLGTLGLESLVDLFLRGAAGPDGAATGRGRNPGASRPSVR